jgi:DNA replication and repair protein RecF
MHLTRLTLTNFRTYAHLELDLEPGITLLQGNNACGKTSLLEAIFYLATARSPHASAERELIRWGASDEPIPFARVEAEIAKRNDTRTLLEIVLVQAPEERERVEPDEARKSNGRVSKRIKVNGVGRRTLDLLGELNAVLFLPEDLDLVFGSPGTRRRYLDTTLSQIDPRYGRALSKYNQIVEQRNSLLRDFRERSFDPSELQVWDRQLIDEGTYLMARRAATIDRYNQLIAEIHPHLTDDREKLQLVYQPTFVLETSEEVPANRSQGDRTAAIATRFAQQIESQRAREMGAALTLVGPHRDDLRFFIQRDHDSSALSMDAITYASRGQGRTIALSLKLAEVALMRAETGEEPVLLLDDVMPELDASRRAALAETVVGAPQALITATDLSDFDADFLSRARVLQMCDGAVL